MIKIRVQGTPDDIRFMFKLIKSIKCLDIESCSDIYDNSHTKNYKRAYIDVSPKKES